MKYIITSLLSLTVLFAVTSFDNQELDIANKEKPVIDSLKMELLLHIPTSEMPKNAIITVTPKCGELKFHPIWIQGEHAEGSYPVINHKEGGDIEYFDVIAYPGEGETDKLSADILIRDGEKVEEHTLELMHGEDYTHFWYKKDKKALLTFEWVKLTEILAE